MCRQISEEFKSRKNVEASSLLDSNRLARRLKSVVTVKIPRKLCLNENLPDEKWIVICGTRRWIYLPSCKIRHILLDSFSLAIIHNALKQFLKFCPHKQLLLFTSIICLYQVYKYEMGFFSNKNTLNLEEL